MRQVKKSADAERSDLSYVLLEARNSHLPAAAAAGLLSRKITGEVKEARAAPS
jgi:hypothetical protein